MPITNLGLEFIIGGNTLDADNTSWRDLSFSDERKRVSQFKFTLYNPSFTPARFMTVFIVAKNMQYAPVLFNGYIAELVQRKRDNGIVLEWDVTCNDFKWRLQQSVTDGASLTGIDTDIISGILGSTYPDLSSLLDISGISSVASGLSLPIGDISALEALDNLSSQVGGANYGFDGNQQEAALRKQQDFDSNNDYTASNNTYRGSQKNNGNPGNCWQSNNTDDGTVDGNTPNPYFLWLRLEASEPVNLTQIDFDLYANFTTSGGGLTPEYTIAGRHTLSDGTLVNSWRAVPSALGNTAWTTITVNSATPTVSNPLAGLTSVIDIELRLFAGTTSNNYDMRLDNIKVYGLEPVEGAALIYGDAPASDINFDIGNDTNIARNISLEIGGSDAINSVTVIGGSQDVSLGTADGIRESDGTQKDYKLPWAVSNIGVDRNTGTDGAPVWTAQTVGIWGNDDLISDGGTADVLYNTDENYLRWDVIPPAFGNSFRATGNIKKPIRVRVSNVSGNDPIIADVIRDESITSEEDAIRIGQSELARSNDRKRLTFETENHIIRTGTLINVTDSARGLNESLVVQSVNYNFLGGGLAVASVVAGTDEDDNIVTTIQQNNAIGTGSGTSTAPVTTAIPFTDDSGEPFTDDSGDIFYAEG